MRVLAVLLGVVLLSMSVGAHELKVYTVVIDEEGVDPQNTPEGTVTHGDEIWFWMKDDSENASIVLTLTKGDNVIESNKLVYECELNETGALVDSSCDNRFEYRFNSSGDAGLWGLVITKSVNSTITEKFNGTFVITEDNHEGHSHDEHSHDEHAHLSDYLSVKNIATLVALISAIGILILLLQGEMQSSEEE